MKATKHHPIATCPATAAAGRSMSRRSFVQTAALLVGGAALAGTHARPAAAQQKLAQAAVKYQNTPNGDKQCANCMQFVPGASADANGTCKVVEGSVSPKGYCIAWTAKA